MALHNWKLYIIYLDSPFSMPCFRKKLNILNGMGKSMVTTSEVEPTQANSTFINCFTTLAIGVPCDPTNTHYVFQ